MQLTVVDQLRVVPAGDAPSHLVVVPASTLAKLGGGVFTERGAPAVVSTAEQEGPRWYRCDDCGQEGTFEELDAIDCPQGLLPHYPRGEPERLLLAERRYETHVERLVVYRLEAYAADRDYDRAKEIAASDPAVLDALIRLGGAPGTWTRYSLDGFLICDVGMQLLMRHGVKPERLPGTQVCSVGFSEREKRWYGWSHRATGSFGVGDVVEQGDVVATYPDVGRNLDGLVEPGFRCETLDDCKRLAAVFAREVS